MRVEPVDIANYYRRRFWTWYPVGSRHYLEANNRPSTYRFLEGTWNLQHTDYPSCAESTQSAVTEAKLVEDRQQHQLGSPHA